jgi:DNA repair protein RadC
VGVFNFSTMTTIISEITVSYKPKESLGPVIDSSTTATELLRTLYNDDLLELREEFIVLFLNRANRVKGWSRISEGGVSGTIADPRIIMGIALKTASCSIIISHNHPSGSLKPSTADRELTRKIKEAEALLDIQLLDHIIITRDTSMSFADEGMI